MNIKAGQKVTSKLISKVVGTSTKGGIKLQGAHGLPVLTPAEACNFDLIKGVGTRGHFSLYSFKDNNGKIIQHYTRYCDDKGKITDIITDIDKSTGCQNITRKTIDIGNITDGVFVPQKVLKETRYSSLLPQINPVDNQLFFSKSFMRTTPHGDYGGLELLQKGKKPHGINYKYNWDGVPTKIKYRNALGQKLDLTEEEARYLPFVSRKYALIQQNNEVILATQDFTKNRVNKKIGLAQIIQEKLHNIEGIMPRAKGVKTKNLHLIKTSGMTPKQWQKEKGFVPKGENLGDGQINIATDTIENIDGVILLDLISHEMQHAADTIKMYRGGADATREALKNLGMTLEEFNVTHKAEFAGLDANGYIKKVIEKFGLLKKGTPEYEEAVKLYEMNFSTCSASKLKSIEHHDGLDLEQRAIQREHQQLGVYNQICQKVGAFLAYFLGK